MNALGWAVACALHHVTVITLFSLSSDRRARKRL